MTEIKRYRNKDLLNRLSEMQRAPYYATACQTLVQAEMAIVALEDELRSALAQQSMQLAHDLVTIECLNDKVMGLLTHGEPVAWMRPSVDGYDAAYRDASAVATSKATGATHWDDNGWVPLYVKAQPAREPAQDVPDEYRCGGLGCDGKCCVRYEAQPAREPMTDADIDKAWRSVDYTTTYEDFRILIARAIEAHHNIKGATA